MTVARMLLHDVPFLIRQLPSLQEYGVRHADLPDIVEQAAPIDVPEIADPSIVMRCQKQRVRRDPLGMKPGFPFSQVHGFGEGFDEPLIRFIFQTADALAGIQKAMLTGMTIENADILPFLSSRAAFSTGGNGTGWLRRGRRIFIHGVPCCP